MNEAACPSAHATFPPSEPRDQVVSSYAIDDGDHLLLFDPTAPPSEIDELAAGRKTVIVREQVADGLRPLLALPVDHVLATHGGPTDRGLSHGVRGRRARAA